MSTLCNVVNTDNKSSAIEVYYWVSPYLVRCKMTPKRFEKKKSATPVDKPSGTPNAFHKIMLCYSRTSQNDCSQELIISP